MPKLGSKFGRKPGRRKSALLVAAVLFVLLLAWWQGGERSPRLIEEDISVPEGVL